MTETSSQVPPAIVGELKAKIQTLQENLQKEVPGYENLLRTIHENLSADDSTVHFLSDEEIGVIVAALSKKKGIVLAEIEVKARKASLKSTTLEDQIGR